MNFKTFIIILILGITNAAKLTPVEWFADVMKRTSIMHHAHDASMRDNYYYNFDYGRDRRSKMAAVDYFSKLPRAKFYYPQGFR